MLENLLRIVFGELNNSKQPSRQADTIPDEEKKIVENITDPEVKQLETKFGKLEKGQVVEISLQEILLLIPRERKRADAYYSLVRKLKAEYEVCLKITSKKTKKYDK